MPSIQIEIKVDLVGLEHELPQGITIEHHGTIKRFSEAIPDLFLITITWFSNVSAGLVAAILYEAIKKRSTEYPKRIRINGLPVDFHRSQILSHIIKTTNS